MLDVELKITSPATHRVEVALPLLIGRGGDMLAINRTRSIGKEMFADDNEKHSLLMTCSYHTVLVVEENQNGIQRSILKRVRATRCCDTYGTTDVLRSTAGTLTNAATIYTATRIPLHTGSPAISTPAFSDPPWHTTASSDALVSNFSLYSHAGAPTGSANWTSIAATSASSILECWYVT